MEAKSTTENGESSENRNVGMVDVVSEEDEEILKRRMIGHPLFGLLIEIQLNCWKTASAEPGEVLGTTHAVNQANIKPEATIPSSSEPELDRFMEAYCIALSKLTEAIEGPQEEATSYIDAKKVQLRDLSETHPNNPKSNSGTK